MRWVPSTFCAGAAARHNSRPSVRLKQTVTRLPPSRAVSAILSSQMQGEEWPGATSARQSTFFSGPISTGGLPVPSPRPPVPRNWGQWAGAAPQGKVAIQRVASRCGRKFIWGIFLLTESRAAGEAILCSRCHGRETRRRGTPRRRPRSGPFTMHPAKPRPALPREPASAKRGRIIRKHD